MEGRRRQAAVLLLTALAVAAWLGTHPPVPQHPDSDLYTHLGVARHLLAGDGFLCDVTYPLSHAFPFAASVPQPLVHRPPGYPLLLAVPVAFSGGDPDLAVNLTRLFTAALLAGVLMLGAFEPSRRGRPEALLPWLTIMVAAPLVDMTVRWCQVEVATSLVLLGVWRLAGRAGGGAARGAAAGAMAGAAALLRIELFWVPWLWLAGLEPRRGRRWWTAAVLAWLVLVGPWLVRNTVVTGNPAFTLQSHAEHLKDTPDRPGMSAYLGMEPETLPETLRRNPGPVLRKTLDGLVYQAARLDNWLPWPLLLAGAAALVVIRGRGRSGPRGRLTLLATTWAGMTLLYAPLSHDLRYMMALMPTASLELCLAAAALLRRASWTDRSPGSRWIVLGAATAAVLLLFPPRMPGWDRARDSADGLWLDAGAALARTRVLPDGPIITDHAAVFWLSGRAGVVRPATEEVSERLRAEVVGLSKAIDVRGAGSADQGIN